MMLDAMNGVGEGWQWMDGQAAVVNRETSGDCNEFGGDEQCWQLMQGMSSGDNKRASRGDNE